MFKFIILFYRYIMYYYSMKLYIYYTCMIQASVEYKIIRTFISGIPLAEQ